MSTTAIPCARRLALLSVLAVLPVLPLDAHAQQQGNDSVRTPPELSDESRVEAEEADDDAIRPSTWRRHEWRYSNALFARANPLGLINQFQIGYRHNLYNNPQSDLLKGSYLGVSFAPSFSPAWARPGAMLEIQPAAVFRASVLYEYGFNFGTFDTIQSFPTPNAEYSDSLMDEQTETASYATQGHSLTIAALLQAKVGPVAVRTNYRAVWQSLDLNDGDTVFYDIVFDTLAPNGGWLHTTDTDVLYAPGGPWTVGLRHTWLAAAYPDDAFLEGESTETDNNPLHRLGPIVVYRFNERTDSRFNQPTLFALANWWLTHRYRTGEDVSQAFPYIIVGFAFNGIL